MILDTVMLGDPTRLTGHNHVLTVTRSEQGQSLGWIHIRSTSAANGLHSSTDTLSNVCISSGRTPALQDKTLPDLKAFQVMRFNTYEMFKIYN